MSSPNPQPDRGLLLRLLQLVVGLAIFGTGVAMMVAADLGLGAWDVFHQGLSELVGWSIGTITLVVGFVVLLGFVPLGERPGLGTLLNIALIGPTVDLVLFLLGDPEHLAWRWFLMAAGPAVIALGSGLYIGARMGPGPRDGLMTGLGKRGFKVSRARTAIEVTVLLAGLALGGSVGAGTLWFTFGIGPMVGRFLPLFDRGEPGSATPPR